MSTFVLLSFGMEFSCDILYCFSFVLLLFFVLITVCGCVFISILGVSVKAIKIACGLVPLHCFHWEKLLLSLFVQGWFSLANFCFLCLI